jgi:hypothetical protein
MDELQCTLRYRNCNQTVRQEIPESADQMMTNSVIKVQVWIALDNVELLQLTCGDVPQNRCKAGNGLFVCRS